MFDTIVLLSSYTTQESQVSCIPPLSRRGYDRSAADLAFFVSERLQPPAASQLPGAEVERENFSIQSSAKAFFFLSFGLSGINRMLLNNGWGVGGVCVFGFLFLSGNH